jgi:hypothetical protein
VIFSLCPFVWEQPEDLFLEAGKEYYRVNSTMIYCENFYKCHNAPPVQQ